MKPSAASNKSANRQTRSNHRPSPPLPAPSPSPAPLLPPPTHHMPVVPSDWPSPPIRLVPRRPHAVRPAILRRLQTQRETRDAKEQTRQRHTSRGTAGDGSGRDNCRTFRVKGVRVWLLSTCLIHARSLLHCVLPATVLSVNIFSTQSTLLRSRVFRGNAVRFSANFPGSWHAHFFLQIFPAGGLTVRGASVKSASLKLLVQEKICTATPFVNAVLLNRVRPAG